jgi:ribose transport system permease protein
MGSPLDVLERMGLLVLLIALVIVFGIVEPSSFLTVTNLRIMLNSQAILVVLAIAVCFPLRTGDFDLSVSSTLVLTGVVFGIIADNDHLPMALAIIIMLLIGAAVGLINGLLVVILGVDAFIATLGVQTALLGLALELSNSQIIYGFSDHFQNFMANTSVGLPTSTWIGLVLAAIVWFIFEKTPYGRYLLFIGGNRDAARLTGLPVRRSRMIAFIVCGLLAAVAGLVMAGSLGAVDPTSGPSYLLQPYAAVFLGTTAIQPGRVNVIGTLLGLYLLVVGITGIELLGISGWITDAFNGGALVVAISVSKMLQRKR